MNQLLDASFIIKHASTINIWLAIIPTFSAIILGGVGFYGLHVRTVTSQDKDKQIARFQSESRIATAQAQSDASNAKILSFGLQKSLAEANVKIAEANQQTETAKASAEQAIKGQRILEEKSDQSRLELEKLRQLNLQLEKQVEKERTARLQIELRMSPRRLNQRQKEALSAALSKHPEVQAILVIATNGEEPAQYAQDLGDAVRAAHLQCKVGTGNGFIPELPSRLEISNSPVYPQLGSIVGKALIDSSIMPSPIFWTDRRPDRNSPDPYRGVIIYVGPKPMF